MRKNLQAINTLRGTFTAIFERFGSKKAYRGPDIKTLLFSQVKGSGGKVLTDHIWFTAGVQFEALNLQPGDKIEFDARVKPYQKGYKGHREDPDLPPVETDYRLSNPTRARVISRVTIKEPENQLCLL